MVVPAGGVLVSAAWLHEPLGPFQITALICVVLSVALETRYSRTPLNDGFMMRKAKPDAGQRGDQSADAVV
jgi:hypothetical protein